jgi:hypothetical protein
MEENSSLFSLSLDTHTKTQLKSAALWARVFAITGLILLAIAFARTIYSFYRISHYDISGSYLTAERIGSIAGYLLVYIIPMFALVFVLRFANKLKIALKTEDQRSLNFSFQNLKIYFRYMAILSIILVGILAISWLIQIAKGGY